MSVATAETAPSREPKPAPPCCATCGKTSRGRRPLDDCPMVYRGGQRVHEPGAVLVHGGDCWRAHAAECGLSEAAVGQVRALRARAERHKAAWHTPLH